tara:strand:+ start:66 stop:479 length:414 start_codon:yes stop_codon:yes gene_type:complete
MGYKIEARRLIKAQKLARAGILFAPASFLNASIDELTRVCNGCGAAGSRFRPPKRIYGTLIVYACIIHDWMYEKGFTNDDKEEADRSMHYNIQRLIDRDEHKWHKPTALQYKRAKVYYLGVKYGGGKAFWKGKNKSA